MELFEFIQQCVSKAPDVIIIIDKTPDRTLVKVSAETRENLPVFQNDDADEGFFIFEVIDGYVDEGGIE